MLADDEGNVLVTAGKNKVWKDKQEKSLKYSICGGNHYANMDDKKNDGGEADKAKAGHMHLTTDNDVYASANDSEFESSYDNWGSVDTGSLMFHQYGLMTVKQPYKASFLRSRTVGVYHSKNQRSFVGDFQKSQIDGGKQKGRWAAATNHLLQQTAIKGEIDPK
eukprot:529681-Ditylum_brightwellii.AAC.1